MSDAATPAWRAIAGGEAILIVADHASAHVPADIALGVDAAVLGRHVAVDIGVAPLAEALCATLPASALLGGVSRLVCDYNREPDAPGLIPLESDGIAVPGNRLDAAGRAARLARFYEPYHAAVAAAVAARPTALIVSLHSFTPRLATRPHEARPWEIGILYNQDRRAPAVALPLLTAAGIVAGDNQPYSGRLLNATMNRHAEAAGRPYLGVEVRQDLIGDAAGVARWAARLAPVLAATAAAMATQSDMTRRRA
ncbi:N-formylglutamate amidohydrolase [Sphingomonas morindae]|uniref:N-formylglutamate amidohydrolase n=1 Tax=Sphingomonas morindae TaxID=1541170 RepID=A0ABY4X4W8_9SPHN|nr:N-formylglutamate amidohydrolase [Sphingomonas morindae]USI71880.1 N-formylglutamate amidohydrolase [Sphingomonas morindae]